MRRKIETTFAAAAFAEAGEHETAMRMMRIRPAYEKLRSLANFFERHFSAVCFAEAGCHEEANRICNTTQRCAGKESRESLDTFLETVGLGNVRVRYGLASV